MVLLKKYIQLLNHNTIGEYMNIKLLHSITNEEFTDILKSVGFKTYTDEQVTKALKNTMYVVKAMINNEIVGMGRVVGDYSIVCMLTDICVKPKYQKMGIGLKIVEELKRLVEDNLKKGEKIQIELVPTAGNIDFYKKAGFKYKKDVALGMYLWIKK